eukprot:4977380-Amphidinium_carterae.2
MTAHLEQWRLAVASGSEPQLDYVVKVLRSPWVCCVRDLMPLGSGGSSSSGEQNWAEVVALAVIWDQPPGSPPSEVLVGLPSHVNLAIPEDHYITANVFPADIDGEEDEERDGDVVQVALVRVPSNRLGALKEGAPREAHVVPFSGLLPGWLPDAALCFGAVPQSLMQGALALFLGGGERVADSCLCLSSGGAPIDEVYVTAGENAELEPAAACLALVNYPVRGASAASGRSLMGGGEPSRGQALRGLSPVPTSRRRAESRGQIAD